MYKKLMLLSCAIVLWTIGQAQSNKAVDIAQTIEALKNAMINADSAQLSILVADDLSYGHSGGKLEDKAGFIGTIMSGSSDFVSIDLSQQSIRVYQKTAIVRHILNAVTNDNGKPGTVRLSILSCWVKRQGHWQMVARQAVRPTS